MSSLGAVGAVLSAEQCMGVWPWLWQMGIRLRDDQRLR